jgi:hypothetical protein
MSTLTEKANQPYPLDLIGPEGLPDVVPPEHPAPWREEEAGNGHSYLYDANNTLVAHACLWNEAESKLFNERLRKINESGMLTWYYQFYCNDCKQTFVVPVQKAVMEIPKEARTKFLSSYISLLAQGKKLIWKFDDPSDEEVRTMERETVHCPNDYNHHIEFVWAAGASGD